MKTFSYFAILFLLVWLTIIFADINSKNEVKKIPIIARTFRGLKNVDSIQVYSDGHAVIWESEHSELTSPEMVGDGESISVRDSSGILANREDGKWIIPDTSRLVSFFLKLTVAYYNTEGYEAPEKTTIPTKFH